MKKRFNLMLAFIASLFTLIVSSAHAAGETPSLTPDSVTTAVNGIGMPALIGAAVAAMLSIAVLIWGGKKIVGFFTK